MKSKFFLKKYELSYQKKFEKIFFKYHPIKNGIEIIKTNLIFFEKKRKFNFFNSLILFILYEVYYFFKYNRETAFRFYLSKDKKLLEEFSLNYEKNTK